MSKPSDGRFDKQQQEHSNRSNPSTTTSTSEEETSPLSTTGTGTPNPVTPAEYIYNSMIPPTSPNLPSPETVEVGVSLAGKRERCNTGDSSASGSGPASQSQPMMSMDLNFLNPDEIMLDGGLSALGVGRLKSSDYVEDFLLPDTAATAACALEAEHEQPPPPPQDQNQILAEQPPPSQDQMISSTSSRAGANTEKKGEFCPILTLTARLERITTGEEIAPLRENFRLSSKDWVQDFAAESADLGPTHPSLFMGQSNANAAVATQHQQQQQQQQHTGLSAEMGRVGTGDSGVWVQDFVAESVDSAPMYPNMFEQHPTGQVSTRDDVTPLPFKTPSQSYDEYQVPLQPLDHRPAPPPPMPPTPSRNNTNVVHNLPPLTARPVAKGTSPASSTTSLTSKKKRKKKRTIDESRAVEPTDNDVLFGRGGYTNTHIGNINFRKRAMELRPWYEQASTSKEEKYRISDLLVESVKSEGHRFLEKGEGGLWHEVIGNGARKKASQALRERIKGSRKAAGGNASSIKSAGSAGAGNVNVDEAIGDIAPASVGDVIGV